MMLRVRVFIFTFMFSTHRSEVGAHATLSFYIHKMGLHFSMTAID